MIRIVDDREAPQRDAATADANEAKLVAALRRGDEAAFERLVERHHAALLRAARTYVRTQAAAEEVVQETWAGALHSLPRFAGRSSLRTWLFRIMTNQAVDYVRRERRSVPFSALEPASGDGDVLADLPADRPTARWAAQDAEARPEVCLLMAEQRRTIDAVIATLPRRQRLVIELRDVEGWSAHEAAQALGISPANQRVLLHRARVRVRHLLVARDGAPDPGAGVLPTPSADAAPAVAASAA
jgi:RNA polymerase sigma-70 factor (ECF subfamily)